MVKTSGGAPLGVFQMLHNPAESLQEQYSNAILRCVIVKSLKLNLNLRAIWSQSGLNEVEHTHMCNPLKPVDDKQ